MIILKVLGALGLTLILSLLADVITCYVRERYIMQLCIIEKSKHEQKYKQISEELQNAQTEKEQIIDKHCKTSFEDDVQRDYDRLNLSPSHTDEAKFLAITLIFTSNLRKREEKAWKFCPKLCRKERRLRKQLENEKAIIDQLDRYWPPCLLCNHNYELWRQYKAMALNETSSD